MPPAQWVEVEKTSADDTEDADALVASKISSGPMEIAARHILVSFRGAAKTIPTVVRTREEARARATELLKRLRAGEDFEALVPEYSDEPGAGARGGALGRFRRESMVKPFSDAAFALKPGEISDIVESPFGFHVIERLE